MMGKDCERILSSINTIKDSIESAIKSVGESASYQITTVGVHGEEEEPNEFDASVISSVGNMINIMQTDISKMQSLENGLYTATTSFNNSCGSPWKELNAFKESLNDLSNVEKIEYLGDRIKALSLLQIALGRAIDARWAIIYYHDYIQRGYDHKFNNNDPSIKFKAGLHRETIGNVSQYYNTNVNIKPKSNDPY